MQELLKKCIEKRIKIISFSIKEEARISFKACENYYTENKGFYKIFPFSKAKSSTIAEQFSDMILEAVNCAAPKKTDIWV